MACPVDQSEARVQPLDQLEVEIQLLDQSEARIQPLDQSDAGSRISRILQENHSLHLNYSL